MVHDRPHWLWKWAARLEALEEPKELGELNAVASRPLEALLSRIHRLDAACWPAFLDLLRAAGPRGQAALLDAASCLLREDQVPEEQREALAEALLALARSPDQGVARAAVFALGCFRQPPTVVAQALLAAVRPSPSDGQQSTTTQSTDHQSTIDHCWFALARLAPQLDEAIQAEVDRLLETAPPSPAVDAALARRLVNRQSGQLEVQLKVWLRGKDTFDPAPLLAALAARQPDPTAQLRGLLAAGADDDVWDDAYHGRIALAVRELVQGHPDLWPLLVDALRAGLEADDWQRHRIALASLARCAEAMPAQFNNASAANLEPLLLRASANAGSFDTRRFAITALSYLRVITPDVLAAILRLAGDTEEVRDDALAAARRFNRLHPSLGQALPSELLAALTGPSALRARATIRLLEALGTSEAAQSAPGLRRQIVQALAAALQDPSSRRPVWVSAERTDGTLEQDLYAALLRVAGF